MPRTWPRARRLGAKLALGVGLAAAVAMLWSSTATWSALGDTASMPDNSVAMGTVRVGDDDADKALLSLVDARPGDSATGCVTVTYTGSVPATMRLSATNSGTGLADHIDLVVVRGTRSKGPDGSCAGFSADSTDYLGAGPGVVYSGTLAAFPATGGSAIVDPHPSAPATWQPDDSRTYRFTATLRDTPAAQGKSTTTTFAWEASST